ncbi:mitogen-activated protein kinase hog1 [Auriculariales sp. MPI-PUGE-AT-0066]|nr:mitogen-activated protein kinase hog1 [Auriculariales sp. MPI-PUGE-AT-0066]
MTWWRTSVGRWARRGLCGGVPFSCIVGFFLSGFRARRWWMSFVYSTVRGEQFEVLDRYTNLLAVGAGAFGHVCSAFDRQANAPVAIKRLTDVFRSQNAAKRFYRELVLLGNLSHGNIIHLYNIFISPTSENVYLVTELMGTDLSRLLASRRLDRPYVQYFTYQILRGLKYIHSAGVVHRDLKPSNILINQSGVLKLADFGLARTEGRRMTGSISTPYYRAPEIMLSVPFYGNSVDIWSTGCVIAEMLEGRALFPAQNSFQQLEAIINLLACKPEDVIAMNCSKLSLTPWSPASVLSFVRSLPEHDGRSFENSFSSQDTEALSLLKLMLVFLPQGRITSAAALMHPFVAPYHDPADEPVADRQVELPYDDRTNYRPQEWKQIILTSITNFLHERIKQGG